MRVANVTIGKLLSPLLVIFRNKIHQCYEMWPLNDKTEGTQIVSIVISTLICDMQFPLWYLLWYSVSTVISTAICHMQFLHTVICTDAIVPLAAGGGGAVRSNLKIGIFIGEKRRRPFGQIRPRCSTVPTSLVQGAGLLASPTLETLSPYHQWHMCGLTLKMICCLKMKVVSQLRWGSFFIQKILSFFKIQDIHWKKIPSKLEVAPPPNVEWVMEWVIPLWLLRLLEHLRC